MVIQHVSMACASASFLQSYFFNHLLFYLQPHLPACFEFVLGVFPKGNACFSILRDSYCIQIDFHATHEVQRALHLLLLQDLHFSNTAFRQTCGDALDSNALFICYCTHVSKRQKCSTCLLRHCLNFEKYVLLSAQNYLSLKFIKQHKKGIARANYFKLI